MVFHPAGGIFGIHMVQTVINWGMGPISQTPKRPIKYIPKGAKGDLEVFPPEFSKNGLNYA